MMMDRSIDKKLVTEQLKFIRISAVEAGCGNRIASKIRARPTKI
jgi:hypothetical protein